MRIQFFNAEQARAQLTSTAFVDAWKALYAACPWATGYQSIDFAATWYAAYADEWEPVIIAGRTNASRGVCGLLALARHRHTGRIANVGDHQAEYQGWICIQDAAEFARAALDALRQQYPSATLAFHYLCPGLPIDWLASDQQWKHLIQIRKVPRPFVMLGDSGKMEASLRKKSNKSRLHRLRLEGGGELKYCRLESAESLASVIDEIASHYDLRQGAVNNSTPFYEDVHKKSFYVALLRAGILHAGTFYAGSMLAAASLSIRSADFVSVGVYAHSPFLARHSPGKFGLLYFGKALAEGGFRYLDLTPGGDWKERFATTHDMVEEATFRFDRRAAALASAAWFAHTAAKRVLSACRVTPMQARSFIGTMRRVTFSGAIRKIGHLLWEDREFRVYYFDAAQAHQLEVSAPMARDSIDDLLHFEPSEPWMSRQRFLANALDRLENGDHVYTLTNNGKLIHYGWLAERQKRSFFTEVDMEFEFPDDTAVLYDYYTHPSARGRGHYQRAVGQMLRDAAAIVGTKRIYISVLSDNLPSRHVIEKLGFTYQCSLRRHVRCGQVRNSVRI